MFEGNSKILISGLHFHRYENINVEKGFVKYKNFFKRIQYDEFHPIYIYIFNGIFHCFRIQNIHSKRIFIFLNPEYSLKKYIHFLKEAVSPPPRGGGSLGTPKSDYVICAQPLKIHIYFLKKYNILLRNNLLRMQKFQTKKFSLNLHLNANDFSLALLTIKSRSPHSRVLPYQKYFPPRKCSVSALRPR